MARNWTDAQKAAMSIQDKNLLVSAAAGSGKTATLTERILRRITDPKDPADISSMLVVTFTRAAAADLKAKMFSVLNDALAADPTNTHLSSQLMKLGNARICTIDSFYSDIVRAHFSELGLSSSFRIADTAELDILAEELWSETIQEGYARYPKFPLLVECFGKARDLSPFRGALIRLYEVLRTQPEGLSLLMTYKADYDAAQLKKEDFLKTSYGNVLFFDTLNVLDHAQGILERGISVLEREPTLTAKYGPAFYGDLDLCKQLRQALDPNSGGYHAAYTCFQTAHHAAIGRQRVEKSDTTEFLTQARAEVKKLFETLQKQRFSKSPETIALTIAQTAEFVGMLYDVLSIYHQLLEQEKRKRGILEFSDLRRYALKLLVSEDGTPTELARQYASVFDEIYIDEYQDVDKVQDKIFAALSNGKNRFMVGDIKQSIYRFRGAEPDVFSSYRAMFPKNSSPEGEQADGVTVFMSNNFRCDAPVIDFTNLVCSYLFTVSESQIHYCPEDDLICSKTPPEAYRPQKVKMTVILPPEEEEDELTNTDDEAAVPPEEQSGLAYEARYIASEIQSLLSGGCKADGSPICPADIAILVRSNRVKPFIADALRRLNIPLADDDSSRYFENSDVQMMLCILGAIDNPHRDIDLAGALRSPIFGFDMNDLLRIRMGGDASEALYDSLLRYAAGEDPLAIHCQDFLRTLTQWRDCARALPIDRFLRLLFDSDLFLASGLLTHVGPNGEGGNLLRLYEYARTFESGSFRGLYQFIEFIQKVIEQKKDLKVPQQGGSSDAVSLMTIHHSKGLEFPICFVAGMGSAFSRAESKESLAIDPKIGIAMKLADGTGFARINTPMREAILSYTRRQDTEEEMRVLYVALTRARERLYVTGFARSDEDTLQRKAAYAAECADAYSILSAPSFLSWILMSLSQKDYGGCCELTFLPANKIGQSAVLPCSESIPAEEASVANEVTRLREAFAYTYPYADFGRIPSKISVSKLSPDILDEQDDGKELFAPKKATVPAFFLPDSVTSANAAERGTATHLFLQFCDFFYGAEYGAPAELSRLVEKKFLPPAMADLVFEEELDTFFQSELVKLILSAKRIYREQRFNLFLSPASFTEDKEFLSRLEDEKLAVQGVIDLILIDRNDRLILVDYKTDRLSKAELASMDLAKQKMEQTHLRQLSYYAKAAELLFGRPCDRLCIYSTHSAKLIDLSPLPLTQVETPW